MRSGISDPSGRFKVLLTLPASRYVHDACTSADLGQFGVSLLCGLMNPQHLKLLSDWSDLYRHLITLAFTQHGPAQRGLAADDLNELSAADQLHAAPIRPEKELLLLVVGID